MTINEALSWMKVLKGRHSELLGLRNENSNRETTRYRGSDEPVVTRVPLYDVKHLDAQVNRVATEIRRLDAAIKRTNAVTEIPNYEQNEDALGTLEPPSA